MPFTLVIRKDKTDIFQRYRQSQPVPNVGDTITYDGKFYVVKSRLFSYNIKGDISKVILKV